MELKPEDYPVGIARVWTKDEAYGQNQQVTLRLYVENIGNGVLDDFEVSYFFTTENGKTPIMTIVEKYYTPEVTITLEHLEGDDYRILFKFLDANIAPGGISPNTSGFSIGIHYSDWSAMDDTNDRSYPGSSTFTPSTEISVTNYQTIPVPTAKYRKVVTILNLHANETEDSGEDECSLFIDADGTNVAGLSNDMDNGEDWAVNQSYNFLLRAKFRLVDRDGDFPGDDDDSLGEVTVNLTEGTFTAQFTEDEANYTITYHVGPYVPAPLTLKKLTVNRVLCNDTLYTNSSDTVTLAVKAQASADYNKNFVLSSGQAAGNYSEHFFYAPAEGDPATIVLSAGSLSLINKVSETADGEYTVSGTGYDGNYVITYRIATVKSVTPEIPGLSSLFNLVIQRLECVVTEDSTGGDEARLTIILDGVGVETRRSDINDGQVWDLNTTYIFEKQAKVNLTDIDGDFPGDDDDDLGTAEIMAFNQENHYVLSKDDATYRLYYKVEQYK